MQKLTAALLLATITLASLPWEGAAMALSGSLGDSDSAVAEFCTPVNDKGPAPAQTDEADGCLCVFGTTNAVTTLLSNLGIVSGTQRRDVLTLAPQALHTTEILSRLFRPPRVR